MTQPRTVVFVLLLLSSPALAQRAAHLLPRTALAAFTGDSGSSALASPPLPQENQGLPAWAYEAGVGAVSTLVAVPASFALASWLGSLSSNLILAALPALVVFAALPPLVVAFAELSMMHWLEPGMGRLWPAVGFAYVAHVALMVGAILLGVSPANLLSVALLTIAEAIVLPAVLTPTLRIPETRMIADATNGRLAPAAAVATVTF